MKIILLKKNLYFDKFENQYKYSHTTLVGHKMYICTQCLKTDDLDKVWHKVHERMWVRNPRCGVIYSEYIYKGGPPFSLPNIVSIPPSNKRTLW
jgi:hypothetical protein